ncbi:hypothetical protein F5148DRAFT_1172756 [Russula earlei]|uniref:Uncharacterized protein n=1 Tax=Russula earlei TaxID=71964 RepID=A0ACC0UHT9_9AGAM|nr:hypothetical protein F5148DRAFT_1172756 [Russula earlei]
MSYRTDNGASYDRTLLSSVPDPTRAEKQEGYDVDILDESRDRRAPTPPKALAPSDQQHGPSAVGYSPGALSYARKEEQAPAPATTTANGYELVLEKVPWYRTRWGIIAIVVVIILIIGGAVGGAVGGTRHGSDKSKSNNSSSDVQGQGQATNSSQQVGVTPASSTFPTVSSPPPQTSQK